MDGQARDDIGGSGGPGGWGSLVVSASALLARHGRLAVHGPWGSGKSTLVDEVAAGAGGPALRVHAREGDQDLPCSGLAQLWDGALLTGPVPPEDPAARLGLRTAAARALGDQRGALLIVEDVQWLDPVTADVLGYCARALPSDGLSMLVSERSVRRPDRAARLMGGYPPLLPVEAAGLDETAAILDALGLPTRWATALHRYSGGHRALLAACCDDLMDTPAGPGALAGRLPPVRLHRAEDLAAAWLDTVPAEVLTTLRTAALTARPDADLLRRAGCPDADDHVRYALRAGLMVPQQPLEQGNVTDPCVRFAAGALARAAPLTMDGRTRRRTHHALAGVVRDPIRAAWHRALAQDGTDPATARDTAAAALAARTAGESGLAAELMLFAARLTPADRGEVRLERLTEAAHDAAVAGACDLASRAARDIAEARGTPFQQVNALLAVIDACGQDLTGAEPLFTAARKAAGQDPALLAAIELRAAVRANVATGDSARALRHASTAAVLARTGADVVLEAAALTMAARMERVLGRLESAPVTLAAALALAVAPPRMGIRNSPEYLAARHAVFDGRFAEARAALVDLLPVALGSGGAEDLAEVWRSLAEVDNALGACSRALRWADSALSITATADLSPGPAWYTAALVHSHGGSFEQALAYATRALHASRAEHDALHTTRSLWIMGAVHLHGGHVDRAAAALAEVAELEERSGADDPAILRWQADAVEAFAGSGQILRAHALLDRMQHTVQPHAAHAVLRAALTRSRALCLYQEGDSEGAVELLDDTARAFAALGTPVEEGRTLLVRGRVERRRRRSAAARTAWEQARTIFETADAHPWIALADEHLNRLTGLPPGPDGRAPRTPGTSLTAHELRLAGLICSGCTNQEAAQQMFVSRKTVESPLSRIYRKLGVRNRTQLTAALPPSTDT
ncbi:LuxR family transcriptional regulator [Streptomyces sp. ASQP_92]|uniref:LuxR family transcriptional regulator n=1 Tax=Streptomyces sp. ASQP_92 TaxID=2979116 RepID=UPI0021C1B366|nr:LuxR family transcriptional regulator [Streptomyces sp. ASQP_92]